MLKVVFASFLKFKFVFINLLKYFKFLNNEKWGIYILGVEVWGYNVKLIKKQNFE